MAIKAPHGSEVNPYRAREAAMADVAPQPVAAPITKPKARWKAKEASAKPEPNPKPKPEGDASFKPLAPAQIRAARALLGLSQTAFGELAKLSRATMSRIEEPRKGAPPPTEKALKAVSAVVQAHGLIVFDEDEHGGPGVRLPRMAKPDDTQA